VIVVDDGSADDTARLAEQAGARVVTLTLNLGKGGAVMEGSRAAAGDILLLADADLGDSAREARALLLPILRGESDMTIATFPVLPGRGGGFGFVVRLARDTIRRETGRTMDAPLSGQRAVRRDALERIGGLASGFGLEVALTIDALKAGLRVVEVPTKMTHRVTGRDLRSILHRLRQYMAVRSVARRFRKQR
jgi:glycosyltransferase involved in cell wall biosynthesis